MADTVSTGPEYAATDITSPSGGSSGGSRSSSPTRKLARLWSTPTGRVTLAAIIAVVMVAIVFLRRGKVTADAPAAPESSGAYSDPLAGLGPQVIDASPIPPGGFDFTGGGGAVINPNPGTGTNEPGNNEPPDPPPTVHVVVDLPPVQNPTTTTGGGATGTQTATTALKPQPKGFYRGSFGASGFTYQDGKGHALANPLTATQRATIDAKDAAMRAALKKSANPAPIRFVMEGVYHQLEKDGRIRPVAAA